MDTPKITVVIRKRPLGKKELARGDSDIVVVKDQATVVLSEIKLKVDLTKYVEQHHFNFDLAFSELQNNEQVYYSAVRPIIDAAFNKARCTCFAYGQTGSGKTFTMMGDAERQVPGMYLMASYDLFTMLQKPEYAHLHISISFYEIYCGKLFDLLNEKSQLAAQEDAKGNVQIKGLSEKKIQNVQQLMQIIQHGQQHRVTSANSANSESSRSHALLQINIKNGKQLHGKLSFIDLAGSERGADVRDQDKATKFDGAEINKSLLALKECIRALDLNKNHTPFRGSKLTLVLKDSLIGNCRTVMIGNISPSSANSEHTLNTLRYADRVKELKKPQEQKSGMDGVNRELFLARTGKSTVLEYKEPSSDEEEEMQYPQGQQGSLKQQQQQHLSQQQMHQQNLQRTHSAQNRMNIQNEQQQQQQLPQPQTHYSQLLYPPQQQQQAQQQQQVKTQQIRTQKSNSQQGPSSSSQQQNQPTPQTFQYQYSQQQQPNLQQYIQQQPQQQQQQQQQNQLPPQPMKQSQQNLYQQQNYNSNYPQQQNQLYNQTPQLYQQADMKSSQAQQQLINQQQQLTKQYQSNQQQIPQQQNNNNYQQQIPNIPPIQFQNLQNQNYQQFFYPDVLNSNNDQNNLILDENDDQVDNLLLDEEPEVDERGQDLRNQQQELAEKILQEEDEIIITHKSHIDDMVNSCKNEMMLLNSISGNQININEYIANLKRTLVQKQSWINEIKKKRFNSSLKKLWRESQTLITKIYIKIIYIMTDKIHYDPSLIVDPSQLLQDSPQMDFAFQNSFYQPYSPYQFKVPPSPYNQMESNCYLESELPFENFPLQRMFEIGNDSHPQSPALKKIVVIKPAQTKQEQDFKVVQVDTNNMTPAKRTNYSRRYYSERLEKKFNRYSLFTDTKEVEVQPPRSQKGLRNLSLKVKDIVIELKSTTYKDVAERLIQELAQENKQIDQDNGYRQHIQESKDEQNIKRRVYDALNVMIASGVLRKEGKKVLSDVYFNQKGKIKRSEREQRKEELIKLRRIVTEKRKRLSELYTKILCLHNLIERNKSIEIENYFDFPILIFQENKNTMKIIMDKKILKILSHRKLLITGDLDILVQMEMYKKNPELIKQMQVPPEIQDFLVGQIAQFCHRHQ